MGTPEAMPSDVPICNSSARDWNRTSTPVKAADFESAASTNSATRAGRI